MAIHAMVDIEALSATCPVQIGIVFFNTTDYIPIDSYQVTIDPLSCKGGPSTSTILWWFKQSQEARDASFGDNVVKLPLKNALIAVNHSYRDHKSSGMWSHQYDKEVLSRSFTEVGMAPAWGRKQLLDYRTVLSMAQKTATEAYKTCADGLVEHIAVNDCFKQLRVLKAVMEEIGGNPVFS